ncbi:MAG: bifunctional phosphoribosyl-AMP cyclohydrolase/phosphoribosyl-ATP diphosphatase HisIE [bacterium]
MNEWVGELEFGAEGLLPVIVQEVGTGEVLMLAYMNEAALRQTLATGRAVFYSRSRKALWPKGETSGNKQYVREIAFDCDADALLLMVDQAGDACHTGHHSCFYRRRLVASRTKESNGKTEPDIFPELYRVIRERKKTLPAGSYTAGLLAAGKDRILKKIGEEAGEVIIAAKNDEPAEIICETADLWFHSLLLLAAQDIPPEEVYAELRRRRKQVK